jgi:GNAT superfamily N-acetyltransferase
MPAPEVRPARRDDLPLLAAIEDDADALYVEEFRATDWEPASDGRWRARQPGFLLVAGDPPVGFAHVLEVDGIAHLEQLAVRRAAMRQGIGTALVRAATAEARARGYEELSLCTFADVSWNAPFYARLGFRVVDPLPPVLRRIRDRELAMDLDRYGPRCVMSVALRP